MPSVQEERETELSKIINLLATCVETLTKNNNRLDSKLDSLHRTDKSCQEGLSKEKDNLQPSAIQTLYSLAFQFEAQNQRSFELLNHFDIII